MDSLVPVVTCTRYNTYTSTAGRMEPVFELFLTPPDGEYPMSSIHATTGVPTSILYSWREQVGVDPEWQHSTEHFAHSHRALSDDVEVLIAQIRRSQLLAPGRSLNRPILKAAVS
jgi:hypothetical protein